MLLAICCSYGCTKKLDLKPNTAIVLPETIADFEKILSYDYMNVTPGFLQVSADDYFIPSLQDWQSTFLVTTRSAAIWDKDIYHGERTTLDWNIPFQNIFYCNSILDVIKSKNIDADLELKRIKGWALFTRAYSYYNLVSIFSKGFDETTASTDLGLPLRLSSGVDVILQRSTVKETYDQILADLNEAGELLQKDINLDKRTRPSKAAVYAMLARVYLGMRKYDEAGLNAEKALSIYSKLTDYTTLSKTSTNAFNFKSDEIIYYTRLDGSYSEFTISSQSTTYGVNPDIINLYSPNDLRFPIYFQKNSLGNYNTKPINSGGAVQSFTGLGTDELFLIKAECLARKGQTQPSMDVLNQLISTRWGATATVPSKPYQNITATSPENALDQVLLERRKSLIWRSVRWTDLKRLNLEGRNITITRNVAGTIYSLEPNNPRYVLPIPNDEIAQSGIQQNIR
ncbi:SusD family protein [Pedobacter nyackensis]|uniref:SusD family protein n=2 Tax=Pedobacter nyackensis TaxID=475255 RepID=A0A1W2A2S0_9SPHI|nr:SusD family protein [Pedobacter nyackensis]